jgi:hypothetical protein
VDTSTFILQRTRRMAQALEGMRRKLEQPISHPDALERRLRGHFGPLGLAHAASRAVKAGGMSPKEQAFMLAELALVISRTEWHPVGAITEKACRQAAQAVAREIRPTRTGDKTLDQYVATAFKGSTVD